LIKTSGIPRKPAVITHSQWRGCGERGRRGQ